MVEFEEPTEEDFADLESELEGQPEPAPVRRTPQRAPPAPTRQAPIQRQAPPVQRQVQAQAPVQSPQAVPQDSNLDRFMPYEMPKRVGFLDKTTQKPIIEDEDMLRVIMAVQAEILNRLERIEASLS